MLRVLPIVALPWRHKTRIGVPLHRIHVQQPLWVLWLGQCCCGDFIYFFPDGSNIVCLPPRKHHDAILLTMHGPVSCGCSTGLWKSLCSIIKCSCLFFKCKHLHRVPGCYTKWEFSLASSLMERLMGHLRKWVEHSSLPPHGSSVQGVYPILDRVCTQPAQSGVQFGRRLIDPDYHWWTSPDYSKTVVPKCTGSWHPRNLLSPAEPGITMLNLVKSFRIQHAGAQISWPFV